MSKKHKHHSKKYYKQRAERKARKKLLAPYESFIVRPKKNSEKTPIKINSFWKIYAWMVL